MQVDSASSSQSFFEGPGSMAGQVDKRWIRSKKSAEKANAARAAPPPKLTPEDTAMGAPVRDPRASCSLARRPPPAPLPPRLAALAPSLPSRASAHLTPGLRSPAHLSPGAPTPTLTPTLTLAQPQP